jgi:hypothetical protein
MGLTNASCLTDLIDVLRDTCACNEFVALWQNGMVARRAQ